MKRYSINLRHYLTEEGCFQPDLPKKARHFAEFFGEIVAAVSSGNQPEFPMTKISCIEQEQKNICGGAICAGFVGKSTELEVGWHCEKCGSAGVISGWEDTLWDMLSTVEKREIGH
jgi:hypothetical protein